MVLSRVAPGHVAALAGEHSTHREFRTCSVRGAAQDSNGGGGLVARDGGAESRPREGAAAGGGVSGDGVSGDEVVTAGGRG